MQLTSSADVVFHREGGLKLTSRFQDDEWPTITPDDWKNGSDPVNIVISTGSQLETRITVREIVPRTGDATGRWVTDKAGSNYWIELPSYAVIEPQAYMEAISASIPREARTWANVESPAHREALRLLDSGVAPELEALLYYDFGRKQKTRSAYLIGDNKLGIAPLPEESQTMPGQSALPRIVTAQCDNVMSRYLAKLLKELFGDGNGALSKRFLSTTLLDTHIGYVALRVIIQGTLWILADKDRRDRQNNTHDYSLQVNLQNSLNHVLANFSAVHHGISYQNVKDQLPGSAKFYDTIDQEAQTKPGTEGVAWKNALFWLPTLEDLLSKPFNEKHVFFP